jgi:hypothetical protein
MSGHVRRTGGTGPRGRCSGPGRLVARAPAGAPLHLGGPRTGAVHVPRLHVARAAERLLSRRAALRRRWGGRRRTRPGPGTRCGEDAGAARLGRFRAVSSRAFALGDTPELHLVPGHGKISRFHIPGGPLRAGLRITVRLCTIHGSGRGQQNSSALRCHGPRVAAGRAEIRCGLGPPGWVSYARTRCRHPKQNSGADRAASRGDPGCDASRPEATHEPRVSNAHGTRNPWRDRRSASD